MTDIFIESMACEQTAYLESLDVAIAEAGMEFLDALDPNPFFEAGTDNQQKSGGIFQALIRLLQSIINAIINGFKKIGNWITGAKVTPEGQNAKINGIDPNIAIKLVNGDIADASDALRKAAEGKMSIEEAKAFINKKESVWNTLKNTAIPVVGLAALFVGKKVTYDKWVSEVTNAKTQLEQMNYADGDDTDSKIASKVAHQYGKDAKKAAAKEASAEIINFMGRTSNRGLSFLMNPIKEAIQKGYLTRNIMGEAKQMETKEGRKQLNAKAKAEQKATNAQAKQVRRLGKNLDKASKQGNKNIGKQMQADDNLHNAMVNTYDNVN